MEYNLVLTQVEIEHIFDREDQWTTSNDDDLCTQELAISFGPKHVREALAHFQHNYWTNAPSSY